MLTWWLSRVACSVFGSLYPAYASYYAVISRNREHHKQWLMYW